MYETLSGRRSGDEPEAVVPEATRAACRGVAVISPAAALQDLGATLLL